MYSKLYSFSMKNNLTVMYVQRSFYKQYFFGIFCGYPHKPVLALKSHWMVWRVLLRTMFEDVIKQLFSYL